MFLGAVYFIRINYICKYEALVTIKGIQSGASNGAGFSLIDTRVNEHTL